MERVLIRLTAEVYLSGRIGGMMERIEVVFKCK
jgi:hypothetical protein